MLDAKLAPKMPQWMLDHVARYQSSGGTDGHMYRINIPDHGERDVPSLLLVTKGRKSGEKFLFPLFYGEDRGSYIIVASKGGAPDHPGWYKNLLAEPLAEIQVGAKVVKVRARTVQGADRARLWETAVKFWPPYAAYQLKVPGREIPVVLLDPVS